MSSSDKERFHPRSRGRSKLWRKRHGVGSRPSTNKRFRKRWTCQKPGEIGALLRREGLYFSNRKTWREQRRKGEGAGLAQKKRGPAPREKNPLAPKVAHLEREVARQKARAERAEALVDLQKSLGDPGNRTEAERRKGWMADAAQQRASVGIAPACTALSIPRATFYRWQKPKEIVSATPRPVARALPPESSVPAQRRAVCRRHRGTPRFWTKESTSCSIRTLYRVLQENGQVREQRPPLRHPRYQAPELLATRPAPRSGPMDLLLSLRGRMDGGGPGIVSPGPSPDRANL